MPSLGARNVSMNMSSTARGSGEMRIDVISNLYPPAVVGGAELSVQLLVDGLREAGCDVRVITLASPHGGNAEDSPELATLPNPNPYWAYDNERHSVHARLRWHISDLVTTKALKDIRAAIAGSPPDIVLTQNLTGIGLRTVRAARASAPGAVFVHTLRDYSLVCVRATRYRDGSNCVRTCAACTPRAFGSRLASGIWNGLVGVSRAVIDVHRALGLFTHVPNKVIPNAWRPSPASVTSQRIPGSLGYLGRISEEKGIYDLLRAMRILSHQGLNPPPLLVGGDADASSTLRFNAEATGLPVRRLGWVEPHELLSMCDWLVVPSRWREPFGRVVLEGAAQGTGLIVARAGGLPEAVEETGHKALFFEPGDVEGLADKLSTLPVRRADPATATSSITPQNLASAYLTFAASLASSTDSWSDER